MPRSSYPADFSHTYPKLLILLDDGYRTIIIAPKKYFFKF
jgi:hypothetical protein